MVIDLEYALALPDESELRSRLSHLVDYWKPRNDLIDRAREMLEGKNPIKAPQAAQFKVQVSHAYHMQAAYNEKDSRFLRLPQIAVTPHSISQAEQRRAADLEKAINYAMEVIELQSDGNVWNRVKRSAIIFDAGVERWERAPAAFWPELVVKEDGHDTFSRLFEDADAYEKAREEYKKRAGLHLRSVYVPLDMFYPVYEGSTLVESFEVGRYSLRQVLSNPLFDKSVLRNFAANDATGGLATEVTVLQYATQNMAAYYALAPVRTGSINYNARRWPDASRPDKASIGQPILLHAYEHGLGESQYNVVGGRNGGWKSQHNDVEGVMEALLELNQDADELFSQALPSVRADRWRSQLAYYDRDARGSDEMLPKPPEIQEGQNIAMWATERLEDAYKPMQDPTLEWLWGVIRERIGELAGSSSVYGVHQPGVTTGYHENLQITMAEHLDNQIEQNLAQGAVMRVRKMLKHMKATTREVDGELKAEKVYVRTSAVDEKGRKHTKHVEINPDDIDIQDLQLSAKVRAERPIDFMANIDAALKATQIRPGHETPLLDDHTALEKIMGFTDPEDLELKKVEQRSWERLLQSEFIDQQIAERLQMAMLRESGPAPTDAQAAQASPAFQQAFDVVNENGEAAAAGGTEPDLRAQQIENRRAPTSGAGGALMGQGGGLAPGQPQPAQTYGRGAALMQGSNV